MMTSRGEATRLPLRSSYSMGIESVSKQNGRKRERERAGFRLPRKFRRTILTWPSRSDGGWSRRLRTSLPVLTTGTTLLSSTNGQPPRSLVGGRVFVFSKSNLCRCPLVEGERGYVKFPKCHFAHSITSSSLSLRSNLLRARAPVTPEEWHKCWRNSRILSRRELLGENRVDC